MITGTGKTEATYRAVMLDSSSSLKDFSFDRKKYYRKYLLNEEVADKDSQASIMGRLVETLLLEPELFDSKFHMSALAKSPTGKMLDFVNALCDITLKNTDENGDVTKTFEEMATEARVIAEFDWSLKVILNKFEGQDPEIYYNEIRTVRANNLTVVTTQDVSNAEKVVESLKTNPVTSDIVNLKSGKQYTVLTQFQVEGYEVDGHLFKSMMDKAIVDHLGRQIQIYDLKCVWAVENFYEEYYLYRRAYIQGFLYFKGFQSIVEDKNSEYYGYEVLPPKFIVCDSTNYFNPLIYVMSEHDLIDAYEGFEYKGRSYRGVRDLISDLQWALETNTWNISRENSLSDGIVQLTKQPNHE